MVDLIYKDEIYNIVGTAMGMHQELGYGFWGNEEERIINALNSSKKKVGVLVNFGEPRCFGNGT